MRRNWLVILVVLVAMVMMIAVAVRQAHQGGSTSQRAAMMGDVKGRPAPDFELTDLQGNKFHLSDLRGKAVLLNFWATWCPPCKVEIPWFVDLQKQYASQGLQVVGVAMDDDASPAKIADFTRQMDVNYTVVLGDDKVANLYGGVESLPTTFYVGRDGKIVSRVLGLRSHHDVEEEVKAALATSAGPKTANTNTASLNGGASR